MLLDGLQLLSLLTLGPVGFLLLCWELKDLLS